MSELPFEFEDDQDDQDEPDGPDVAFRAAMHRIRLNGWTPTELVVPLIPPTAIKAASHIAALACEYNLPIVVDLYRDIDAGIGIRYEGDAPNLENPSDDKESWQS